MATNSSAGAWPHLGSSHSAVFAEVKIDEQLGVIRVTRVVNAVAAGRMNAVYHATGRRVRDLPITLDKLMRD